MKSSLIEFSGKSFTYLPVSGPPLYTKHNGFFSPILVALFVNNPNKCFVSEAPCFWIKRSSAESVFDKL